MAITISRVLGFLRIFIHSIFPTSPNPELNTAGRKVAFLLFLHILSALFVCLSVYATEKDSSDETNVGTWAIVMVFVTVGIISLVVLIVRGYQNKLKAHGIAVTRISDPSLNLRILFLWIFGLAVIVHILINVAIYIQCMTIFPDRTVRGVITELCSIMLFIFLLVQTSFISYFRNFTFVQDAVVNIASIAILMGNFVVWFNTEMSYTNVFDMYVYANATIQNNSNEFYCFKESSIKRNLGMKLEPFFLPPRLQFCILASSFIISFWIWPFDHEQRNIENRINRGDDYQTTSTERSHNESGTYIFAAVSAIILNIPVFLSHLLLAFVFDWTQEDVFFAMHLGQCISSLCIIIAIYICSYHLIKRFTNCCRAERLTTNEYILIISSSGTMAFYTFGLLRAVSSPVPVYMFFISRITALLETFLQTHFFIKLKRYKTDGKTSVLISSVGILLMIKNLLFWFVYSYNAFNHATVVDLVFVDNKSWSYKGRVLDSVKTFYRFFSGMISYSVHYKFRPLH